MRRGAERPSMRAIRVRIQPEQGWFGPFHRATTRTDDISLEAVHALRLLADGSSVLLYEYTGDRAVAEALAAEQLDSEVGWQVTELSGRQLMYANTTPSAMTTAILGVLDEWKVVVDWPIRIVNGSNIVLTLVGDDAELQGAIDAAPEGVRVRVERTGEYRPGPDRLLARLTPRERETLRAAVELGYYENPREATYEEVADVVDCAAGTVGHHLRNAETKLLGQLIEG
jgi:DNA-binding CsgD family transcriptional regulator